jgi:transposase
LKTWVGVDVSKLTLDLCWFLEDKPVFLKVSNEAIGFNLLFSKLPSNPHLLMEATGAYYLRLAHFLMELGVSVSVINPLSIKRYAQMKLARAKTDKYNSALIAGYGDSQEPET